MQAYTALQAEFTRRSQRLKRYEKEEENQVREGTVAQERIATSAGTDASTQSEQGPSSPEVESINDVDGTQEATGIGLDAAADDAVKTATNEVGVALNAGVAKEQTLSLYEQVMASEEVRLKVIGDYLSSIGKSGAPLLVGGRGMMQTPPKKPSSISDAGKMALAYLKTQGGGVAE